MSTGSPSSKTPKGYSYSASGYIYEGENKRELSGWGNEKKGNWAKGTYKIEIWYNDMCLKTKSFTLYVCSKVNFPHFRLEKGTT